MLKRILFLLVAGLIFAPDYAHAWWDTNWSYRKKITIDGGPMGANLAEDAGRMPVLVRLHDGNFRFTDAKEDGSDIRFIAGDDKTPLSFHFEVFDGVLGIALAWVDVAPVMQSASTDIYIYSGNANAPAGSDAKGTYDAETALVYHFAERNAAPRDDTAFGNTGQGQTLSIDTSEIGRGIKLDGNAVLTLPASPSLALAPGTGFTWSAWIKADAAQPDAVIYSKREGANVFIVGLDQGSPFVSIVNGGTPSRAQAAAIAPGSWHHIAITASERITLYVDGRQAGVLAATLPAIAGAGSLGGDPLATPRPVGFVGELDELQISRTARNAGFIAASFASQGPEGNMVSFGQDEENSTFSTGYFGVILKSVTLDGWVVIAILMVMAAISLMVMVTKTLTIVRVARANAHFLEAFTHAESDIGSFAADLAASKTGEMEESILFKICGAGGAELGRRMAAARSHRLSLTPQAIATIRASLDRISAYESKKLNAQMVLLTIAISGGPFLGLLGTVVGVMITFAAIAATGDVNINAIAPGIAAALVATVAGLAVAIPALFGYNYLITRIKDLTTEMHVFTDEFVTRLGLDVALSDNFTAGLRLATGNTTNPVSVNQNLGTTLNKNNFLLDRAYLAYRPVKEVQISFGRFANPLLYSELVWDDDINFDGAGVHVELPVLRDLGFFGTGLASPIEITSFTYPDNSVNKEKSRDKWLFGAQIGTDWRPLPDVSFRAAGAYYHFDSVQGQISRPCVALSVDVPCSSDYSRPGFTQGGNTMFAIRDLVATTPNPPLFQYFGLASPFREINATAKLDFSAFNPVHVMLDADFVKNVAFNPARVAALNPVNNRGASPGNGAPGAYEGGNIGFDTRLTVGHPVLLERGDWLVTAGYRYIESDATMDAFNDSKFRLGGTNAKGYIVTGGIGLSHNVNLITRWMSSKEVSGAPYSIDVVQVDLNAQF